MMMNRAKSALAISLVALATSPAVAQTDLFEKNNADWLEITGSIASMQQPFFQLAPVPSANDGTSVQTLQRLPTDARQLRFEGENGRRDLPFYLRKDQIVGAAQLKIGFLNSISVMPEASRMTVSINDRVIAEIVLDAATEQGHVNVPIPAGVLEAGYNGISFQVQQRHRVDCSIEAANELWTQIDLTATGILASSANLNVSQFEDLSAMPAGEDGATLMTVVLPKNGEIAAVDQALRAAQALAIRVGLLKPRIVFTRDTPTAPGIHLYVGTNAELRARGIELLSFGDTAFSIKGRLNEHVQVAIGGVGAVEVDQNIFRLVVEKPNKAEEGSAAGLRALGQLRGVPIKPEQELSFEQAGIASEDFNGRLYRAQLNVVMPPDFYPADYGKATLFLDASYVAGLATTNEAHVRVNGKVAGVTRLRRSGGEDMVRRPIELTLKALQPGFNSITLEVRTATEEDKDCNPLSLIEPRKRLSVQGTTAFALPRISRINHLPNLGAAASTGFPFTEQKKPVAIYLPKPDYPTLSAAATLLVRQALAAGRPFDTRVSQKVPDASVGSALIVGAINDIPVDLVSYFGIKDDMLPESWRKTVPAAPAKAGTAPARKPEAAAQPANFRISTAPAADTASDQVNPASPDSGIRETVERERARWGKKLDDRTWEEKVRTGIASFLSRNIGYTPDQLSFIVGDKSTVTATRATKLVMAQQQSMAGGNASWLLLSGPDASTIARETTGLISQTSWNQLSGRIVAYDPTEAQLTHWPVGTHYHYEMRDWSLANVTLVAAGWLSNHIQYYILVILMACGIFGFFTRKLLNRIGAQP